MATMPIREFIIVNGINITPEWECPKVIWVTGYKVEEDFRCCLYLKEAATKVYLWYHNHIMYITLQENSTSLAKDVATELLSMLHGVESGEVILRSYERELRRARAHKVFEGDCGRWSYRTLAAERVDYYKNKVATVKVLKEILKHC